VPLSPRRRSLGRLGIALTGVLVLGGLAASPAIAAPVSSVVAKGRVIAEAQSEDTVMTITKKVPIRYATVVKKTSTLKKGVHKTTVKGVAGVRTKVISVTVRDGVQVSRKVVSSTITKRPVSKVVLVGTKIASSAKCDPNYSGECVPIASDVDCAGGSGNGPGYVYGPVEVIGSDIYDLDRDGDGVGCD
jgi:hypothetical protein